MDGHEAGLAELRAPDGEDAGTQVQVVAVESECLAEAQTGRGEQAEERGVGVGPQPHGRGEPCGLPDDTPDLVVAVDVGRAPPVAVGQKPRGWDLGAWVGGAQPGGEAAYIIQTACPRGRCRAGGGRCPADRKLGRHDGRPLAVEELHETAQGRAWSEKLCAQPATQGEVRFEGLVERTHRTPPIVGQGSATSRRASKSSLA